MPPAAFPSSRPSLVERSLARSRAELPALAALFDAFGPILLAQERLRASAPGWRGDPPALDPERFCLGAPLLAEAGFQNVDTELPAAAESLLPLMAQSLPALAGQFDAIRKSLFSGAPASADVPGVAPDVMAFAVTELLRPFLARQAEDLLAGVRSLPWRQSVCPVCGGAPNMSALRRADDSGEFIQAVGGRRFLRCSRCGSEWSYKRVSCPACGCEEPDELTFLRAKGGRCFERIDACRRCKAFLPCLDTAELIDVPDLDVAALAMLPLCTLARREGYVPLAPLPWGELE